MADCGCTAARASGDPAGRSINALNGLAGRKKKKGAKKGSKKRAKKSARKGGYCVKFRSGKKMCGFKSKQSAGKMARRAKAKVVKA